MRLKKKLLALAVMALPAAIPTLANAQSVKFYGLMDAYAGGYKTTAGSTNTSKFAIDSGGMTTSYWGFGGSEDLGGGLKAVFAAEAFLRTDTGQAGRFDGDSFFARNSYVGFSGGFGQATIGRNTTPYFLNTIIFNPFGDSFVFSPMVLNTFIGSGNQIVLGDTGFKNSIRYTSPSFGGLTFDLLGSAGDENAGNTATGTRKTNRAFDAQALYFGGAFSGGLVVRKIYLDTGTGATPALNARNQTSVQLGLAYDMKVAKVFFQAQQQTLKADLPVGTADQKGKTGQIGVSVPVGAGSILASYLYSKYDNMVATSGKKRQTAAIGYDYFLSKRTDLYAMYTYDKFNSASDATATFAGSKQQSLGFGIRHRF